MDWNWKQIIAILFKFNTDGYFKPTYFVVCILEVQFVHENTLTLSNVEETVEFYPLCFTLTLGVVTWLLLYTSSTNGMVIIRAKIFKKVSSCLKL